MKIRMLDGSGSRQYRYLKDDIDRHGNVRIYFRRKGQPKIRLRAKPGSAEFDREYQAAYAGQLAKPATGKAPAARETLEWLCQQYWASQTFAALNKATRSDRRRVLQTVCDEVWTAGPVGTFPYAEMEPPHVRRLRDAKATFPDAANQRVKIIRALFTWACDPENALAKTNPAERVKALASKNLDGHKPWTVADVEKYYRRHPIGTRARLALDLLLYTGVRRSDVMVLGPHMEHDGKLVFEEWKGRARIKKTHSIPILPPLRESIKATKTIGQQNYILNPYGKPYSDNGFGNWFKQCCREAFGADTPLSAHGVRKLAAQLCAEAGATSEQIKALFGWRTSQMADRYTKAANARRLEADAAEMLGRKGNKKVAHFPVSDFPVGQKS